jgi:hypothetical protein
MEHTTVPLPHLLVLVILQTSEYLSVYIMKPNVLSSVAGASSRCFVLTSSKPRSEPN